MGTDLQDSRIYGGYHRSPNIGFFTLRAFSSVAALLVTTSFAGAQVSDDVVKIGVLTDLKSDEFGPGRRRWPIAR